MLFIYRLLINLGKFLIISVPLQALGAIVLLIYLPIHFKRVRADISLSWKLPACLRWFDCGDLYSEIHRNPVTYLLTVLPQGWWATYCWLAWRNPLNYFNYKYLSYYIKPRYIIDSKQTTTLYAQVSSLYGPQARVGDSQGEFPGYHYGEITLVDNTVLYEYYFVWKWSDTRCFRLRLGYKLDDVTKIKEEYVQDVINIQIFRSYGGV